MSFRTTKETARVKLHEGLSFAALCYADGPTGTAVPMRVRKHTKTFNAGDLAGTSLQFAEVREESPKLIFLVNDHRPERGHVYALETGDVYEVDHVDAPDGITITAYCTDVREGKAMAFILPEGLP